MRIFTAIVFLAACSPAPSPGLSGPGPTNCVPVSLQVEGALVLGFCKKDFSLILKRYPNLQTQVPLDKLASSDFNICGNEVFVKDQAHPAILGLLEIKADLCRTSLGELTSIPGVGPKGAIQLRRAAQGRKTCLLDELGPIKGFGPKKRAMLSRYLY